MAPTLPPGGQAGSGPPGRRQRLGAWCGLPSSVAGRAEPGPRGSCRLGAWGREPGGPAGGQHGVGWTLSLDRHASPDPAWGGVFCLLPARGAHRTGGPPWAVRARPVFLLRRVLRGTEVSLFLLFGGHGVCGPGRFWPHRRRAGAFPVGGHTWRGRPGLWAPASGGRADGPFPPATGRTSARTAQRPEPPPPPQPVASQLLPWPPGGSLCPSSASHCPPSGRGSGCIPLIQRVHRRQRKVTGQLPLPGQTPQWGSLNSRHSSVGAGGPRELPGETEAPGEQGGVSGPGRAVPASMTPGTGPGLWWGGSTHQDRRLDRPPGQGAEHRQRHSGGVSS